MEDQSLVRMDAAAEFMPLMSIEQATERYQSIVKYVKTLLHEGTDFGKIPGTDKNVLLKPGAEKLCTLFGLTPSYELMSTIEDWIGAQNGEPFFYYRYRCTLTRHGAFIADSEASANSHESKYRWRKGERLCPECGKAAIIKGRAEYGGGWLCFGKKGGCGFKWADGDQAIESQNVDRVPNPDIADQVNTLQKMAQKRALLSACLLAVNASEFFTVDLEDFTDITPTEGQEGPENGHHKIASGVPSKQPTLEPKKTAPKVNAAEETEIRRTLVDVCKLLNTAGDKPAWGAKRLNAYAVQEYGLSADVLELEPLRELLKKLSLRLDDLKRPKKVDADDPKRKELIASILKDFQDEDVIKYLAEHHAGKPIESLSVTELGALYSDLIPF